MSLKVAKIFPPCNQDGVTLLAALFFLVIVAIFGILALRLVDIGSISSSENVLFSQSAFSAAGARDLRILNIMSGGTYGWDGSGTVNIAGCSVQQIAYKEVTDKGIYGANVTIIRIRLKSLCSSEGSSIGRTWETIIKK